jgi:hypothetical protein
MLEIPAGRMKSNYGGFMDCNTDQYYVKANTLDSWTVCWNAIYDLGDIYVNAGNTGWTDEEQRKPIHGLQHGSAL